MIDTSRRGLLLGLGSLIVAPAIVRASSLMPIRSYLTKEELINLVLNQWSNDVMLNFNSANEIFAFKILNDEIPQLEFIQPQDFYYDLTTS